jgi:hypothetical protein
MSMDLSWKPPCKLTGTMEPSGNVLAHRLGCTGWHCTIQAELLTG